MNDEAKSFKRRETWGFKYCFITFLLMEMVPLEAAALSHRLPTASPSPEPVPEKADTRFFRDVHYGTYAGFSDTPVVAFGLTTGPLILALAVQFRYDASGIVSPGGDVTTKKFSYGLSLTVSYMFRNQLPLAIGPEFTFYGSATPDFLDYKYFQLGGVLWYSVSPTVPIVVGVSLATRLIITDARTAVFELFTPAIRLGFGIL